MLPAAVLNEVDQLAEQLAVLLVSTNNPNIILLHVLVGARIRAAEMNGLAEDYIDEDNTDE